MFVNGGEKFDDFGTLGGGEFDVVLGDVTHFGSGHGPAGLFEGLADGVEVGAVTEEAGGDVIGRVVGGNGFHVLRAGLNGDGFEVERFVRVLRFDNAEVLKHPRHAPRRAELALFEEDADFGRGAAAVVGEAFDDDGDFVGGEAFVGDEFVIDLLPGQASAFFDGAFDGIARDGLFLGSLNGGVEAGIEIGVGATALGGDLDFFDQLAEELAAFQRADFAPLLFPLGSHNGQVLADATGSSIPVARVRD